MALRQTYLSMKSRLPDDAEAVLVMRSRGNDELAPSSRLLEDFNAAKKQCSELASDPVKVYECAWKQSDYEKRFREEILSNPRSMARLKRLAEESKERDIFLICYESEDKPCHRRILLSIAEERLGAVVDATPFKHQPDAADEAKAGKQMSLLDDPSAQDQ
jgi:uncharacterized protein YeaO (DUF488 family)